MEVKYVLYVVIVVVVVCVCTHMCSYEHTLKIMHMA